MDDNQQSLLGTRKIHTETYKNQAYDLIKNAILYNRFRVDAIYSQEAICTELGISRTPVREALLELQKEGYVSFARGRMPEIFWRHEFFWNLTTQNVLPSEVPTRKSWQSWIACPN